MPDSNTNLAVQVLETKLEEMREEYEAQRTELEATIARLLGGAAPAPAGQSRLQTRTHYPAVRPHQYEGMTRKAALQAYLNERPGKVLVTKAAADMLAGGAPMGKDKKRYRRYLRVTITQNPKTFIYEEDTDTVRLKESPQQRKVV